MALKTIFLDRDGVINHEINYLHKINDFIFINGIFDACSYFNKIGFEIIVISNQSGISRGFYTSAQYEEVTRWMKLQFETKNIKILNTYHCPHSPEENCNCRKPKPGLFLKARKKYNINMKKSWLIGDKEDDITAANKSGVFNTILVKSGHEINESKSKAKYFLNSISELSYVIDK